MVNLLNALESSSLSLLSVPSLVISDISSKKILYSFKTSGDEKIESLCVTNFNLVISWETNSSLIDNSSNKSSNLSYVFVFKSKNLIFCSFSISTAVS